MVKELIKLAGKAVGKAKSILFFDPKLLYKEQRNLINQPFFFDGTNGKGVLLVHGWSSTAYEVRRLGKYLNENGYTVYGLMLSGHGTVPKDLENVTAQDWIDDVERGYGKLKETCQQVYVAGTSIGASIALILAEKEKEMAGIILMATPYRLRLERIGVAFVKLSLFFSPKQYRTKFYPPTFGASDSVTRLISYQQYPTASVLEVFKLVQRARKNLASISQPCLLLQSTHDHMVSRESMEKIFEKISSKIKKKIYIQKAYHTFIPDIKNEHVFQDILNFLEEN
ncbi:MAG: alpha/beta fold hydrolase [Candidatus Moranbacteria bacterium]|nr:alpha/beta fold hydrolase [Candidatus Moranbacteria bacterium]